MENNIGTLNNPTVNSHYTRAGLTNSGRSGGMSIPTNKSIDRDDIVVYSEADPETDRSFRLNRTQSISSTSSDKMERPSYSYSNQSPHGMQPYGIGEPLLNGEQDLGPSSYAHASQINTLLATTVEVRQMS
ncbi:hypothetical protein BV898_17409 [Hypsibius exemplaris]|uniref:Uncharacterized protein n=1 Tax=Hypsibius exemplaris TaxID=2072580 RepID=A0A9X6RMS3_HYPEX|nr:hypothetical protein BV898_17409 [Hypsibius exemplaris]